MCLDKTFARTQRQSLHLENYWASVSALFLSIRALWQQRWDNETFMGLQNGVNTMPQSYNFQQRLCAHNTTAEGISWVVARAYCACEVFYLKIKIFPKIKTYGLWLFIYVSRCVARVCVRSSEHNMPACTWHTVKSERGDCVFDEMMRIDAVKDFQLYASF